MRNFIMIITLGLLSVLFLSSCENGNALNFNDERWSVQSGTWSNINMNDLSLLKKGSKITYTFQSSDYYKMEQGKYSARFRFCGTEHCTPNFNLNQKNGRVWVGHMVSNIDNIIVENK